MRPDCEKDVVSTSGTGRARGKRRTLGAKSAHEVRRYRRGHELRDDGRGYASHPRFLELFGNLTVGCDIPCAASGDDREPFRLDARLGERAARGFERQARGAAHEALLLLAEPERRRIEIAGVKADDSAPAAILHGRFVDRERSVVATAKIRRNPLEIIAKVAAYARPGDDDPSLMSCHILGSLS